MTDLSTTRYSRSWYFTTGLYHNSIHCRVYQYSNKSYLRYGTLHLDHVIRLLTRRLVIYGIYGIKANWGRKDAVLRDLPYLGLMSVGIGSTIFHASLKYYTQWCMHHRSSFNMTFCTNTVQVTISLCSSLWLLFYTESTPRIGLLQQRWSQARLLAPYLSDSQYGTVWLMTWHGTSCFSVCLLPLP